MLPRYQELSRIEGSRGCNPNYASARIHGGVLVSLDTYARDLGHDLLQVINELGLSFGAPSQWGGQYVSQVDFGHLLDELSVRVDDPCLGLNWCTRRPVSRERLIGLAARYAPTPLEALQMIARFLSIAIDTRRCEVEQEGDEVSLVWSFSPLLVRPEHLSDGLAAEFSSCFREEFGRSGCAPVRVELARRQPKVRGYYGSILGAPVQFEARSNRLVFSTPAMLRRNGAADPMLYDALVELCARRFADLQEHKDFVSQVSDVILARIDDVDLNLEVAARELGMSPRVLQRKLAEKSATFQDLYDRMRRELASELLRNTTVPISEIAYRLGFSAVGNFTRAAKRWYGVPPKRWRHTQAGAAG
ncbi:helix-turn-helix transcriptional regulator [Roseibium aestuarii]|uniref:AraC family transcriptional regulator ligand-binding domain-containing protein n=1 Tax=Roseibium aestuarii TaxID=2600299 RepID=A0ABW4JXJ6_9HYPH|nr:AraC family transcriptional regulator [Roseibium aestuarii]